MQKSSPQKINISVLQTDLQLNYNGHFSIIPPSSHTLSPSIKYIENNRHRNWDEKQLQKFAAFLHYHHQKLATIDTRKVNKIFKVLSQFVQTRNVNQCRIFATKMIRKFSSIQRLNLFFKESLPKYAHIIERQKEILEKIIKISSAKTKGGIECMERTGKYINNVENYQMIQQMAKKDEELKPTDTQYPVEASNILSSNLAIFYEKQSMINSNEVKNSLKQKNNRIGGFFGSNSFTEIIPQNMQQKQSNQPMLQSCKCILKERQCKNIESLSQS